MPNVNTTSQIARIVEASDLDASPNHWDGYDIPVANGETVRVIPDDTALRVLRFNKGFALMGEATFSGAMPDEAIVAVILATARASA